MTGLCVAGALARKTLWRAVLATTGGISVKGDLPSGGCVVVANHSSHADTAALLASLPAGRRPLFIAAADYWGSSATRRWACRTLGGGYEVRRGGGGSADLAPLVDELRAGRAVVIFPEGTRSRDGSMQDFHSGAFRLAAQAGVPVVPVGLRGTSELLPVHGEVHRTAVQVRIGSPLPTASAAEGQTAVSVLTRRPVERPDSEARRRVAAFAVTPSCLALVIAWAFFEAIAWPLIPEVLLVALVVAAPTRWWRFTLAAVLAGVVGGTVMLSMAAAGIFPPQPLVTDAMRTAATSDVTEHGARAVYEQPFSGIPYKVYATAAGEARIEPVTFAVHSSIARGSRFALVAGLAALLAVALSRWRRYYLAALLALGIGFTIGLLRVVAGWSS